MAKRTDNTGLAGIRQRTHENVDSMMDKAESMRDNNRERMDHIKEKALEMRENVDGYIKKNPEKSVLIAAGVGAVLGAMLTGAMMRKRNQM